MKATLTVIAAIVAGVAIVGGAVAGCAVFLYKGSTGLETVGTTATFEESADCLVRYANPAAGRPFRLRLDDDRVVACFPEQTAAKQRALIACFNAREREDPGFGDWPEDDMRGCTWDGLTEAELDGVRFGPIVPVPAPPRAGQPVVVEVGLRPGDADAGIVDAAVESGELDALLTVGDATEAIPLDIEWGLDADGKIHVSATVPEAAAGKRLTITLTTEPGTADEATKVASFTVAR